VYTVPTHTVEHVVVCFHLFARCDSEVIPVPDSNAMLISIS